MLQAILIPDDFCFFRRFVAALVSKMYTVRVISLNRGPTNDQVQFITYCANVFLTNLLNIIRWMHGYITIVDSVCWILY